MIASLLIANRGEIACRVIRTARAMGIRTIAVYSDADARALHVRQADAAVHIGPSPAGESYLRGDRIIAAALQAGAEAIHPGYGFLSENADFAQAVMDAGLIWVGPDPASIRAMGLKDEAKALMQAAGVPVTPGYLGEDQSPERLQAEATAIGYPVLIKAVAGGGGKGMRQVDSAAEFDAALQSCRREAQASFANDAVLIERLIRNPRHVEVQIFGDRHGNVVHLFERDCSLQRRHQKVIEEAPAPGMDDDTRQSICAAAVRAAKAVNYVGAGTIEFIAETSGDGAGGLSADRIWFMEMNTRLQVEHPVTEEITGVDLVEWQLRVASGEPIPLAQDALSIKGHAIEARLYAEDPAKGFLPSIGRLEHFNLTATGPSGAPIRIETGVEQGDEISPFYDPLIAKLVAWGEDRASAIANLAEMASSAVIWPVMTNAPFITKALQTPAFAQGAISTAFIDIHADALAIDAHPQEETLQAAAHALLSRRTPKDSPGGAIWAGLSGFRLNAPSRSEFTLGERGERYSVQLGAAIPASDLPITLIGDGALVTHAGQSWLFRPYRVDGTGRAAASDGTIIAPMPGKVIALDVAQGDTVTKGQRLMVLEAMKMEHALTAPFDGTVAELAVQQGAQVQVETTLARIAHAKD